MKEIGEQLKNARERMGVSIEEVSEDLKVRPSQIENIEAGNREAFDDVFSLKYFIRDYAKYLGLDKDDMVDEFNEFLFDLTSRLSLEDIKVAKKDIKTKKQNNKIKSPYTKEEKEKKSFIPFLLYTIIVILIVSIVYFIANYNDNSEDYSEGTIINSNR